jgi:hypothetical protein
VSKETGGSIAAVLLFLFGLFTDAPIMCGRIVLLVVGGYVAYFLLTALAFMLHGE